MAGGTVYTAMDACTNRAIEGLRVCEDIFRFIVRDPLSSDLKSLRHDIVSVIKKFSSSEFLKARDIAADEQKFIDTESEMKRSDISDIFRTNIRRAAEASRSLEELAKTLDSEAATLFQEIRFRIYEVEKIGWFIILRNELTGWFMNSLYAVIDPGSVSREVVVRTALSFMENGVKVIQLRMKNSTDSKFLSIARELSALCKKNNALFIVNGRPDIALLSDAHGLHLEQGDIPVKEARRVTGHSIIIGFTIENPDEAESENVCNADYLAAGTLHTSMSAGDDYSKIIETEALSKICSLTSKPVVCMGGANHENIHSALQSGCTTIAVTSSLDKDDNISAKISRLSSLISSFSPEVKK